MRTIKFRGKRAKGECVGEWAYGELTQHNNLIWLVECEPDTIGQFTGCLDANGKEIYEGDILKVKDYEITGEPFTYVITYDDFSPRFLLHPLDHKGSDMQIDKKYASILVVIDNNFDYGAI